MKNEFNETILKKEVVDKTTNQLAEQNKELKEALTKFIAHEKILDVVANADSNSQIVTRYKSALTAIANAEK